MEIIVTKAKWLRGVGEGEGSLLNASGKMCCLGFACVQSGVPKNDLLDRTMPRTLSERFLDKVKFLTKKKSRINGSHIIDNGLALKAADINDDDSIDDNTRMARLTSLFKKYRHTIKFV